MTLASRHVFVVSKAKALKVSQVEDFENVSDILQFLSGTLEIRSSAATSKELKEDVYIGRDMLKLTATIFMDLGP